MRILPSKSGTLPVRQDALSRSRGNFLNVENLQENLRAHWSTYFADTTAHYSSAEFQVIFVLDALDDSAASRIPMRLSSWLTAMTRSGHRSLKSISCLWL